MCFFYCLNRKFESVAAFVVQLDNTNTKHETEIGGAAPARMTPNEGQRNTSTSSRKMKIRSPNNGKNQSNKEEHSPKCTSRLHEKKVT